MVHCSYCFVIWDMYTRDWLEISELFLAVPICTHIAYLDRFPDPFSLYINLKNLTSKNFSKPWKDVRGPPISGAPHMQLQSWLCNSDSAPATPAVAAQLQTLYVTLIMFTDSSSCHQPRYTCLAYLLYSPFSRLSGIYSCHP